MSSRVLAIALAFTLAAVLGAAWLLFGGASSEPLVRERSVRDDDATQTLPPTAEPDSQRTARVNPTQTEGVASFSPTAELAGVVQWPDGSAAGGARVSATADDRVLLQTRVVRADAEGRFRIDVDPSGTFRVSAAATHRGGEAGGDRFMRARLDYVEAPSAELVLRLTPGTRVTGNVRDETGAPVQHFMITANFVGDAAQAVTVTETFDSPDGEFELTDLADGRWLVFAQSANYTDDEAQSLELPLHAPVHFELYRNARVTGTVVDSKGAPIARAEISAEWLETDGSTRPAGPGQCLTDERGRFALQLPAGAVRLWAQLGARASERTMLVLEAHVPVSGVTLRLAPE